jgi:outer membrane usher protein
MYTATSNLDGRMTHNANASGSLLDDSSLTYSAGVRHTNDGSGARSSAGLSYRSPYATLSVNRDQGKGGAATTSGTIAGGMVLHSGGLTLAQSVGDTVILVSAPGAGGVAVENNTGIKTNSAGYAVVPNASPYRVNNVALRVEDLPDNAEVKNAKLNVVPTKGAVVLAQYETRQGYKAFLTLRDHGGSAVPFSSKVYDSRGREAGIVGSRGRVYLTGLDAKGELDVVWGGKPGADGCRVKYELPIAEVPVDTSGKKGRAKILTAKASCMQTAALEKR